MKNRAAISALCLLILAQAAGAVTFQCNNGGTPTPYLYLDQSVTIKPTFQVLRDDGTNVDQPSGSLLAGQVCEGKQVTIRPLMSFTALTSTWTNTYDQLPANDNLWNNGLPTGNDGAPSARPIDWTIGSLPSTGRADCVDLTESPLRFPEDHATKSSGVSYSRQFSQPPPPNSDTCDNGQPDNPLIRCKAGKATINLPCSGTLRLKKDGGVLSSTPLSGDNPVLNYVTTTFTLGPHSVSTDMTGLACVSHFKSNTLQDTRAFVYTPTSAITPTLPPDKTITAVSCAAPKCQLAPPTQQSACPHDFGITFTYQNVQKPPQAQAIIQCPGGTPIPSFSNIQGSSSTSFLCRYASAGGPPYIHTVTGVIKQNGGKPDIPCDNSVTVDCTPAPPPTCSIKDITPNAECSVPPDNTFRVNMNAFTNIQPGMMLYYKCDDGFAWQSKPLNGNSPVSYDCIWSDRDPGWLGGNSKNYVTSAEIHDALGNFVVGCGPPKTKTCTIPTCSFSELPSSGICPITKLVSKFTYANAYKNPNTNAENSLVIDCGPGANPPAQYNKNQLTPPPSQTDMPVAPPLSCKYTTPGTYTITGKIMQGSTERTTCQGTVKCDAVPPVSCKIKSVSPPSKPREAECTSAAPGTTSVTIGDFQGVLDGYELRSQCGDSSNQQLNTCNDGGTHNPTHCLQQDPADVVRNCNYAKPGEFTPTAAVYDASGNWKADCTTDKKFYCPPTCTLSPSSQSKQCAALFSVNFNYVGLPSGMSKLTLMCLGDGQPFSAKNVPTPDNPSGTETGLKCSYGQADLGTHQVSGKIEPTGHSLVACSNTVTVECTAAPPADCIGYV